MSGEDIEDAARDAVEAARLDRSLAVSAISAWEVALLASKRRAAFDDDAQLWWRRAIVVTGADVLPLEAHIAIASTRLPGRFHADPADRILVATARHFDLPIVTADKSILAYAKAGHLKAVRAR